jgi:HEAT repeat protein
MQELIEAFQGSDNHAQAVLALLLQGQDGALHILLDLARHADANVRWWAARGLSSLEDPLASSALAEALSDPDPSVRQCAGLALRNRAQPEVSRALARALSDSDRLVARLASESLASMGRLAMPSLAEASRSPDPAVRIEATRALATMNDKEAIPLLFEALEDSSSLVAYWAERGLERLGVGMVFFPS